MSFGVSPVNYSDSDQHLQDADDSKSLVENEAQWVCNSVAYTATNSYRTNTLTEAKFSLNSLEDAASLMLQQMNDPKMTKKSREKHWNANSWNSFWLF